MIEDDIAVTLYHVATFICGGGWSLDAADILALSEHIQQVRSGKETLTEFCRLYGLPEPYGFVDVGTSFSVSPGCFRARAEELALAVALEAYAKNEHLGRTEAMRAALEAVR